MDDVGQFASDIIKAMLLHNKHESQHDLASDAIRKHVLDFQCHDCNQLWSVQNLDEALLELDRDEVCPGCFDSNNPMPRSMLAPEPSRQFVRVRLHASQLPRWWLPHDKLLSRHRRRT